MLINKIYSSSFHNFVNLIHTMDIFGIIPVMYFTKEDEESTFPLKKTKYSSGYDLYSKVDTKIQKNNKVLVDTGIKVSFKKSIFWEYHTDIRSRSGLALKGIRAFHGLIDEDYRGTLKVLLNNNSNEDFVIKKGDRIAQLVPCMNLKIRSVNLDGKNSNTHSITDRGQGAFGSTGYN